MSRAQATTPLAVAQPRQILFRRHQRQPIAPAPRRAARRSRFSKTDGDRRRRACATTSIPLARSVLKNRAGSPIPAKASTRLPASDATEAASGFRCADSTGPPRAATAAATASAARAVADHDQRIGAVELLAQRRAQRACGKHAAIAEAAVAVDHDQRGDPWRWRDSGTRRPSGSRWRPATAPGPRRRRDRAPPPPAAVSASISGSSPTSAATCRAGSTLIGPLQSSAIAAAEHDRRLAEIAQQLGERQHRRGLAGAADVIIADAKHGDAGIETLALQAQACDQAIEGAERRSAVARSRMAAGTRRPAHALAAPISSRNCSRYGSSAAKRAVERAAELRDHALRGRHRLARARPDRPATGRAASPALPACRPAWRRPRRRAPHRRR